MSNAFLEDLTSGIEEKCTFKRLSIGGDGTGTIISSKIWYALHIDDKFNDNLIEITVLNEKNQRTAKTRIKVSEVKKVREPNEIFLDSDIIVSLRVIEKSEIMLVKLLLIT